MDIENKVYKSPEGDTSLTSITNSFNDVISDNLADADTIEKLSKGLLSSFQPELQVMKSKLNDLTNKQISLLSQLQSVNHKMNSIENSLKSQDMFEKIKLYQVKLITLKKDMTQIHDKVSKLKKRAMKMQQTKQKEALQKEHRKEIELQREQELIGKPGGTFQPPVKDNLK